MATREEQALDQIAVADRDNWADGPPHEDFRRLRRECPVHWGEINDQAGYYVPENLHGWASRFLGHLGG